VSLLPTPRSFRGLAIFEAMQGDHEPEHIEPAEVQLLPSTPVKRKQSSLFETWGWSQEKSKKCDGRTTYEAPQADSHKKLRKLMNGEALVMFEKSLEKQRELEHQLVIVRSAARTPSKQQGRGCARGMKMSGRPKGSMRSEWACTKHTREKGGPVLRRDPTATEKLEIVKMVENLMKDFGVESPSELDYKKKHEIEKRFHYSFHEQIERWFKQKTHFEDFIASNHLGKHGIRPCGSRGRNVFAKDGLGARISLAPRDTPTTRRPLAAVWAEIRKWLNTEREHGHEVRMKTITQRVLYQLEYERDRQLVLSQHNSESYFEQTLRACRGKLHTCE
jgi:hypothetical protein